MMSYTYVGTELDLFAAATRWKAYLRRRIEPFLGADVLEVGAGVGGTTRLLCRSETRRWVCLEPDPTLAARLEVEIAGGRLPACCSIEVGILDDGPAEPEFDSILYMDVLEHIEDDSAEMGRAARRLRPGGHVIVVSPAHNWLFSAFDEAIGHFRRYTKATLRDSAPADLKLVRLDYIDSVGMLASLGNRLVLGSAMPTARQVAVWDKLMVPVSRVIDPLLGYAVGKSILGVWRKPMQANGGAVRQPANDTAPKPCGGDG